jgi:hypothetical protein
MQAGAPYRFVAGVVRAAGAGKSRRVRRRGMSVALADWEGNLQARRCVEYRYWVSGQTGYPRGRRAQRGRRKSDLGAAVTLGTPAAERDLGSDGVVSLSVARKKAERRLLT